MGIKIAKVHLQPRPSPAWNRLPKNNQREQEKADSVRLGHRSNREDHVINSSPKGANPSQLTNHWIIIRHHLQSQRRICLELPLRNDQRGIIWKDRFQRPVDFAGQLSQILRREYLLWSIVPGYHCYYCPEKCPNRHCCSSVQTKCIRVFDCITTGIAEKWQFLLHRPGAPSLAFLVPLFLLSKIVGYELIRWK